MPLFCRFYVRGLGDFEWGGYQNLLLSLRKQAIFPWKTHYFGLWEAGLPHKICPISVRNCKLRIIMLYEIRNFHRLKPLISLYFLPFQLHSVRSAPISPFSIPSHLKQAENLSKIDIFSFLPFPYLPFSELLSPFSSHFCATKKTQSTFHALSPRSSFPGLCAFFRILCRFWEGWWQGVQGKMLYSLFKAYEDKTIWSFSFGTFPDRMLPVSFA